MESADPDEKVTALEAELAAKSSRIAELEARVSLLEAENSRLKKAMAEGEAAGLPGEQDPIFGRLEEDSGRHNQTAVGKLGGGAGCDVLVVLSDDEEGIAVDASKGRSPEKGVVAVPTTQKRGVCVVAGEREDMEGDSESNKGEARRDSNLCLEDDDVSVTALGKKRAAVRVVTSDSEDEDVHVSEVGSGEDDDGEEASITATRKRALRGVSDSEDEDADVGVDVAGSKHASHSEMTEIENEDENDKIPISRVLKKIRKERVSDDDELGDAKEPSTPATRCSARLVKKRQAANKALSFVEPKEYEGSEDDMEEDNDMDDFINDADSSEDASDSAEESGDQPELSGPSAVDEESSPEPNESDIVTDYKEAIACIGRKRKAKVWNLEGEMLAAFREHPELCLKAVCALYRKQTEDEQLEKSALFHNKQGFSHTHATRGSFIAEFLLAGNPYGPLKKTVHDLNANDLGFCQMVASHYSKQLFAIYQNKEDPYFHP